MSCNEIIGEELLFSIRFCILVKELSESKKFIQTRFLHLVQNKRVGVFRCNFHLSGDMFPDKCLQVTVPVFFICKDHIVPDA